MCCGSKYLGRTETRRAYKRVGMCAVCKGLDNDESLKDTEYCELCGEWICNKCTPRWFGRGWLATKKIFKFN